MLRWDRQPLAAVLLDLDDTILDNQAGLEAAWERARLRARTPAPGLVTNGAADAQRAKIERWGLAAFFDAIAIEGEVGAGKHDPRHFGAALAALAVDPAATLMAGDNYHCDVLGALELGMHAVWIDRERRVAPAIAGAAPSAPPPRPHRTLASFVELVEELGA